MDTKNSKYSISVLMDLSNASKLALSNAAQLAKAIDGRVEVLHIKVPTAIVKNDNQLSAVRSIHKDTRDSKNQVKEVIKAISKQENLKISLKMVYGNEKNSVKDYISEHKPNFLVLDKGKSKILDAVGNNVNVLITNEAHKFHSFKDVSLGIFDDNLEESGLEIFNDLKRESTKPVRLFSIKGNQESAPKTNSQLPDAISYVFTEGANVLDGLSSYVNRTNTELLCIPNTRKTRFAFQTDRTKQLVNKLNVPVLIMAR